MEGCGEREIDDGSAGGEADFIVAGLVTDGDVEGGGFGEGFWGEFEAEGEVGFVLEEGGALAVEGVGEDAGCLLVDREELDGGVVVAEADFCGDGAWVGFFKRVNVPGGVDEAVEGDGGFRAGP